MSERGENMEKEVGADQEQEKEASVQEEFRPLIELPKGWNEEIYNEFANIYDARHMDFFVGFLKEEQAKNPDIEIPSSYKLVELKSSLFEKLQEKGREFLVEREKLQARVKNIEDRPELSVVSDINSKLDTVHYGYRREEENARNEFRLPLMTVESREQVLKKLKAELANLSEPKKPGLFSSRKTKDQYNDFIRNKEQTEKNIERVEADLKIALAKKKEYEQRLDEAQAKYKKELLDLENQLKEKMKDPGYKKAAEDLQRAKEALSQMEEPEEIVDLLHTFNYFNDYPLVDEWEERGVDKYEQIRRIVR